MSHHIGSVFLGDVQRQRILSTSTPPSSPPPLSTHSSSPPVAPMSSLTHPELLDDIDEEMQKPPSSILPEISLDLRLRWLETLLFGAHPVSVQQSRKSVGSTTPDAKNHVPLVRGVEDLQRRLATIVHSSEGLKRFMDHYEQHSDLLNPTFALSATLHTSSPTYDSMSPAELEALLTEMEADVRAADRDLREIEMLESKDVTAAGRLPEYEALQPRLDALQKAHEEDLQKAADLEQRISGLVHRYATNVETLSDLFVAWDDTLRDTEIEVARLEKDHAARQRVGVSQP